MYYFIFITNFVSLIGIAVTNNALSQVALKSNGISTVILGQNPDCDLSLGMYVLFHLHSLLNFTITLLTPISNSPNRH